MLSQRRDFSVPPNFCLARQQTGPTLVGTLLRPWMVKGSMWRDRRTGWIRMLKSMRKGLMTRHTTLGLTVAGFAHLADENTTTTMT